MRCTAPVIITFLLINSAAAECYVRQSMTAQQQTRITSITDMQYLTVPVSTLQHKCIVTFRALLDGKWITGEGEHTAERTMAETDVCRAAMDFGQLQIVNKASAKNFTVETNMVCDERPEIAVRNVRVGDVIRESEVRIHPNFLRRFRYLGAECRWFIEPVFRNQDMGQYQGIICQSHATGWRVIDKW